MKAIIFHCSDLMGENYDWALFCEDNEINDALEYARANGVEFYDFDIIGGLVYDKEETPCEIPQGIVTEMFNENNR